VLLAASACGESTVPGGAGGSGGLAAGGASGVLHPTVVEELALPATTTMLPAGLGGARLTVAVAGDGTALLGAALADGTGSLWRIQPDGVVALEDAALAGGAVVGFASTKDGLIVATPMGLFTFSGSLTPSPLTEVLGMAAPLAIATRGDELWIGTGEALVMVAGGKSLRFAELPGVTDIDTFAGGSDLVLADLASGVNVLRSAAAADPAMATFTKHALGPELAALRALPAQDGRLVGVSGGALLERVAVTGGVAWKPLSLAKEDTAPGAAGVEAVAVDPVTGSLWIAHAAAITRVTGSRAASQARPAGLGKVTLLEVTSDGSTWISDGAQLVRLGAAEGGAGAGPITYTTHIAPFATLNCTRCHVTLGRSHPLTDYQAWMTEVDNIIKVLEEGRMPDDGRPLEGGGVDLIRRWRAGGLVE
jgi:hypothetical protein